MKYINLWKFFIWIIFFFPIIFLFIIIVFSVNNSYRGCRNYYLEKFLSPDNIFEVLIIDELCSDGLFITTSIRKFQIRKSNSVEWYNLFFIENYRGDQGKILHWEDGKLVINANPQGKNKTIKEYKGVKVIIYN